MNRPRRLALVTRRFWPLVGGAEMLMSQLATAFRERGARPTIVTAQWQSDWPTDLVHQETPVVRLPNPNQRFWGTIRYMIALARWMKHHQSELDVIYVSMLKHDAYATLGARTERRLPVVLRAEGSGETGDCRWQQTARFGDRIRRRCLTADAIVAPSRAIYDELLAAGYPNRLVRHIPNGVVTRPARNAERRWAARQLLAESNPDLATREETPVVIFTGRLARAKGLFDLLHAWSGIAERWSDARLWLVGDGPDRDDLFELILDLGLRHQVVMPGAFDDVQDLLDAADLFVLPSYHEGLSIALLEAMAAGVPIVASDIPGNREVIVSGQHGMLLPPGDVSLWAAALSQTLGQPARSQNLVAAAHERVCSEFSRDRMTVAHEELFEELLARRQSA